MRTLFDPWGRGPHDEILPPPLVAGLTPDEALDHYIAVNAEMGVTLRRPVRPMALDKARETAVIYLHLMRLRAVIAGQFTNDDEEALYMAVLVHGEPVSLRPPVASLLAGALEDYAHFAPVLRCLTPGEPTVTERARTWRFGVEGLGRCENFDAVDPAQAVAQAQMIYTTWAGEELYTVPPKALVPPPIEEVPARPTQRRKPRAANPQQRPSAPIVPPNYLGAGGTDNPEL